MPLPLAFLRRRGAAVTRAAAAAVLLAGSCAAQGMGQEALPPEVGSQAPSFTPLPPPSLNFYGSPGGIDMPSAEMMPDGQFANTVSSFGGQTRVTLTFQATPWMSASFRYHGIRDLNLFGFKTYYDRNFDVRFRLWREGRYRPQVALGLQDFSGTGLFGAEYIVASKTFRTPAWGPARDGGRLMVTGGVGWGRLGSYNRLGSLGARPAFNSATSSGGEPAYDQWFRGPYALFGGIEWRPNDRLGLKLEYSSDDYVTETQTSAVFNRRSPFNFGVEYQWTRATRLGAYYLYGSEIGVSAQIQLNPRQPVSPMVAPAPYPVRPRSQWAGPPESWDTDWSKSRLIRVALSEQIAEALERDGLVLESLEVSDTAAELRYRNPRYTPEAAAAGRAARAMAARLPPTVETFRLVPVTADGMALAALVLRRSDLEALEFDGRTAQALLAVTGFADAAGKPGPTAVPGPDLYPDFSWSVAQYFSPSYFDPSLPFRLDLGADLRLTYRPAPGWRISGKLRQRVWGNVKDGRLSNSVLPHVRTDRTLYAQYSTTLENLYVARQWRPGRNLYARITAGYFEMMYGGISGEILWKPVSSRLGLGIEGNYVVQRDYDQRLGFRDYRIFTGHASAYVDLGRGYHAQVDAGRYLAGDYGATFSLDRIFANGWSVGGFFTLTNVSAADFGEGSFDKGIRFRIPVSALLGRPSRAGLGTTIRPVQRDGGQRVEVPGRLYDQVREAHRSGLEAGWARVWE